MTDLLEGKLAIRDDAGIEGAGHEAGTARRRIDERIMLWWLLHRTREIILRARGVFGG